MLQTVYSRVQCLPLPLLFSCEGHLEVFNLNMCQLIRCQTIQNYGGF